MAASQQEGRTGPVPDVSRGRQSTLEAIEAVTSRYAGAVTGHVSFRDEETLTIEPAALVEICRFLKDDPALAYDYLIDITATHWLDNGDRYEVAYLLCSLKNNSLLRLKVRLTGAEPVDTVTGIWATADWHEREEWDKVGVVFSRHPNLKRILMPEDWEGHPLRKDYPMEGIGA
ncbi:MAG TPA: NADH-quinone oxidoreductase subunit C [Candidatus Polarisedimenticolia bacterium]|nr:NADH-quinone oxidoreductase subunit C [Candidatus Polarisedimenticolia bacterium]